MQTSNDQPIYRFMDLFELYELAVNKKLKFTKLRLMEDKNEGLGEILKLQSNGWGFSLRNDRTRLRQEYEAYRECIYISCWTHVRDAMAMWLLYSKNHSSFRVKTSLSKLRNVLDAKEQNPLVGHHQLDPGSLVPILHDLSPVEYVDFNEIHQRSREKLKAFDLAVETARRKGDTGRAEYEALFRDHSAGQIEELQRRPHLKDKAFLHENEVRASFHLRIRNKMTLDEFRQLPDTISNVLGNPMLHVANRDNSPNVVSFPVPSDFIEEICFDSRMPLHNQTTIEQMLGHTDFSYVTTNVFGSIIDEHDLTIRELNLPLSEPNSGGMLGGLLS